MQSKQGRTLPVIGLSEGHINVTTGIFKGATTFHCVADGQLGFKYNNQDRTIADDLQGFIKGDSFGVQNIEYIKIMTGTFHIGFD